MGGNESRWDSSRCVYIYIFFLVWRGGRGEGRGEERGEGFLIAKDQKEKKNPFFFLLPLPGQRCTFWGGVPSVTRSSSVAMYDWESVSRKTLRERERGWR